MDQKIKNSLLSFLIMPVQKEAAVHGNAISYLIGGIIALLIMGYLIYTLMRPDKF
jgi:K+-transporting ATPase KdpF subunit